MRKETPTAKPTLGKPESDKVVGEWTPPTVIPHRVRDWGYFPDVSKWHAGDLILTSAPAPDRISALIVEVQADGYGKAHAQWTHAAVYLGDGLMLCEAQFDPPATARVIVTPIWEYVGTHTIKVRRSRPAEQVEKGWAIATAVATKINGKYDTSFVVELAGQVLMRGKSLADIDSLSMSKRSFICSTLYSTAHAYVTDIALSDKRTGACLPAYLSSEGRHLFDVPEHWVAIR